MATWKISNYHKKNAVERQIWIKDGMTLVYEEGFRWGTWTCESDEKPDVDLNNPDGYDVMFTDYDWELDMLDDGCWGDIQWPDDMPEDERDRLQELIDEHGIYEALESMEGWVNDETENWIYGPIQLVNEDTGEEFVGEE